ncbi:hypothetical protein [Flavobacterium sp. W20_MBD1_R3]|uniref:hypothetical protein n=1 Tax=Flavobacterium sp. W20_MBD1_R3 TaxID=3240278 RepID=UPI003F9025DE
MVSKILLILFLTFLITPTIVTVIEKNSDISIFYNASEEENVHKEIKVIFYSESPSDIIPSIKLSSIVVHSENLSKHDNNTASIFIPPPDQM